MCIHSVEAGESSQSDLCQPTVTVLSGDDTDRHCSDVESEDSDIDASSDSLPEDPVSSHLIKVGLFLVNGRGRPNKFSARFARTF